MEKARLLLGNRHVGNAVPVTLAFLGVLIANLPVTFIGPGLPPPLLGLMPLYFWSLVRPDLMSPAWVFVIGVAQDMVSGGPPGIWALAFVATYALLDRQRDAFAGLSGAMAILGFAIAAMVACVTAWLIVALFQLHLPAVAPMVVSFAMTVLLYVPGVMVLSAVHRHLVGPARSDF